MPVLSLRRHTSIPIDVVNGIVPFTASKIHLDLCLEGSYHQATGRTERTGFSIGRLDRVEVPCRTILAHRSTLPLCKYVWKGLGSTDTISWISPVYRQGGIDLFYNTQDDNREEGGWEKSHTYTAECKNAQGIAEVLLDVHDGSFGSISQTNVHGWLQWLGQSKGHCVLPV